MSRVRFIRARPDRKNGVTTPTTIRPRRTTAVYGRDVRDFRRRNGAPPGTALVSPFPTVPVRPSGVVYVRRAPRNPEPAAAYRPTRMPPRAVANNVVHRVLLLYLTGFLFPKKKTHPCRTDDNVDAIRRFSKCNAVRVVCLFFFFFYVLLFFLDHALTHASNDVLSYIYIYI